MIRKTDQILKRKVFVWDCKVFVWDCLVPNMDRTTEIFRRETWWILCVFPIYIRETVIDKPR